MRLLSSFWIVKGFSTRGQALGARRDAHAVAGVAASDRTDPTDPTDPSRSDAEPRKPTRGGGKAHSHPSAVDRRLAGAGRKTAQINLTPARSSGDCHSPSEAVRCAAVLVCACFCSSRAGSP